MPTASFIGGGGRRIPLSRTCPLTRIYFDNRHFSSCSTKSSSCPFSSDAEAIRKVPVSASCPLRGIWTCTLVRGQIWVLETKKKEQQQTNHTCTPQERGFKLTSQCLCMVSWELVLIPLMKKEDSWMFEPAVNMQEYCKAENRASEHTQRKCKSG